MGAHRVGDRLFRQSVCTARERAGRADVWRGKQHVSGGGAGEGRAPNTAAAGVRCPPPRPHPPTPLPPTPPRYYTLTFSVTFRRQNDSVFLAHSYPYTYADHKSHLQGLLSNRTSRRHVQHSVLCKTLRWGGFRVGRIREAGVAAKRPSASQSLSP